VGRHSEAIGARLRAHIEAIFKALVLEIDKELRRATPVDTGNARAAWMPSVGVPNLVEEGSSAAHAAGVGQVLAFKLGDGALWVSNGVDYVPILNYGTSDQAPPLWIEAAIDRAVATINARYNVKIDIDRPVGAENLASAYSPFGDDP
jgi:hypothetical protein